MNWVTVLLMLMATCSSVHLPHMLQGHYPTFCVQQACDGVPTKGCQHNIARYFKGKYKGNVYQFRHHECLDRCLTMACRNSRKPSDECLAVFHRSFKGRYQGNLAQMRKHQCFDECLKQTCQTHKVSKICKPTFTQKFKGKYKGKEDKDAFLADNC